MAKYILAYDVGTSNTKAVLVDVEGKVHGRSLRPYNISYPQPGWAEQSPDDWWNAVIETTREVLAQTKVSPADILCVVFSTQLLGIVPMDEKGNRLGEGIIWMDSRAPEEAKWIMNKFLGEKVFSAIAGASINGKDVMPKLVWLKNRQPEVYNKMKCFLDVNSYLTYRCSGKMVMSWSDASVVGLDLKSKKWMTGIFKYLGLDTAKFPELINPIEKVGGLTAEAAQQLGLLEGTPVMAGGGDCQGSAVGSGAVGEGEGHISMGTSAWVGVVTKKHLTGKNGIATIQSGDPDKLLLMAQMELAGGCLKWLSDEMCRVEKKDPSIINIFGFMDDKISSVPAGSDYLIFMPWMYGERSPIADPFVRSGFVNLTPEHTREHMMRAVYEGVAYNIRWAVERVENEYKFMLPSLRIMGGGSLGHPWMQIIADVTGRRVETVNNPQEAGAVGIAMAAAVGLGIYKDFDSLKKVVTVDKTFEPDPKNRAIYDLLFNGFKELYVDLKSFYFKLNKQRTDEAEEKRRSE
jgi:xylulokinase